VARSSRLHVLPGRERAGGHCPRGCRGAGVAGEYATEAGGRTVRGTQILTRTRPGCPKPRATAGLCRTGRVPRLPAPPLDPRLLNRSSRASLLRADVNPAVRRIGPCDRHGSVTPATRSGVSAPAHCGSEKTARRAQQMTQEFLQRRLDAGTAARERKRVVICTRTGMFAPRCGAGRPGLDASTQAPTAGASLASGRKRCGYGRSEQC
jgi:hypothetical protein